MIDRKKKKAAEKLTADERATVQRDNTPDPLVEGDREERILETGRQVTPTPLGTSRERLEGSSSTNTAFAPISSLGPQGMSFSLTPPSGVY